MRKNFPHPRLSLSVLGWRGACMVVVALVAFPQFSELPASPLLASTLPLADDLLAEKTTTQSGISIELPKNWQAEDHPPGRSLLVARAPARDKDLAGEFQTLLTIDSDTVTKLDGRAQQDRVAKSLANYKPVDDPTPVTINGVDGIMFGGTFTHGSVKLRTRQYLLLQNNRLYILTFTSLDSAWSNYSSAIEASAATFAIAPR